MTDHTVLNPTLYAKLQRRFGDVRIRNQGEARLVRTDPYSDRQVVQQWGEQYCVACPFCRDVKPRLAVSYLYGQRDTADRQSTNLAYCHNRKCLADPENRAAFAAMLARDRGVLDDARVFPGRVVAEEERRPALPDSLIRVDQLPEVHPARTSLEERGFDPNRVGRLFAVSYCPESTDSLARDRIIIPIKQNGELCGWQSISAVPSLQGGEKYLSARGLQASHLVYNLDTARDYQTCVIVRDPMTVWTFGLMAICPLGYSVSAEHMRKILGAFRRRTVAILLTAEELRRPDVAQLVRVLTLATSGQCVSVKLPTNATVGDLGRNILRDLVRREAEIQGKEITFDTIG